MARGGLSHNQRQSQVWAAYRAVRDGQLNSGRVSKTTSSRGGTAKRGTRKPYTPANFGPTESQYFGKTDDWNPGSLVPGKKVVFGDDFRIGEWETLPCVLLAQVMLTYQTRHSAHIDAIVAAGLDYCHSLRHFESGDTDSGNGSGLTDASVIRLAEVCPNLIHVSLEASIRLTDSSLLALVKKCPELQYVQISGNDKVAGRVDGPALEAMTEDASLGRNLQKFRLTDQSTSGTKFSNILQSLSAKRKKLAIEVGEVRERGPGVCTWVGGKKKMGYQAFGAPGGFTRYGGF